MESLDYSRFIISLVVVLAGLYFVLLLIKRFGIANAHHGLAKDDKQISILETKAVDGKRRLMRVQNGVDEHLILTGGGQDLLISSTQITKKKADVIEK